MKPIVGLHEDYEHALTRRNIKVIRNYYPFCKQDLIFFCYKHDDNYYCAISVVTYRTMRAVDGRAIRFSENVVADIREWTSTWGRRALDFGGRAGYHDFNQI